MGRIYSKLILMHIFINGHLCTIIFLLLHRMENENMENGAEVYVYVIVAAVSFLITAISLIAMLVNEIRSHRQAIYRFDSLDKGDERLSAEHSRLEGNLRDIVGKQDVLKDKVFEYINREKGRRENLASILPQQDVLSQIQLLYDKILVLSDENTKLKYQNQQLQEKLNHMSNERDADNHQFTEQEKSIEQAVEEVMSQEEPPEQYSGMEHEM